MPTAVSTRDLKRGSIKTRPIRRTICAVFRAEDVSPQCEVSVVLTSDSEIRELNRQYLRRDHPTDVLAFRQSEARPLPTFSQKPSTKGPPPVLGDVVISVDTARRQAEENGLTLEQELSLLTIHGVLHLLGYEDETPARRKKMQRRQQEILANLYPELAARTDGQVA